MGAVVLLIGCRRGEKAAPAETGVREAIVRAGDWMAAVPEDELRFDAAIGLHAIRQRVRAPGLDTAWDKARRRAERDDDSPLRRFFDDGVRVEAASAIGWAVPGQGARRVNVNRPLAEALHCAEHGMRDETLDYLGDGMRDGGGYHTAHALWALVIARERGCVGDARYAALRDVLAAELVEAQPEPAALTTTMDLDLFAERLLMLELAGVEHEGIPAWRAALIARQDHDGSWGNADDHSPAMHYHATLASAWALAAGLDR